MIDDPRLHLLLGDVTQTELLREFAQTAVVIRVAPDALALSSVRVAAARGADLAARLFDNVRIVVDGDEPSWIAATNARVAKIRERAHAEPYRTVTIGIGPVAADVYVGFQGWSVAVSRRHPTAIGEGTIGALLAGPVIAAEAFKGAFGDRVPRVVRKDYIFNVLTYGTDAAVDATLPTLELDSVLVGCGSVGFGFVDALAQLDADVVGRLDLVDNGVLETKNVYKYAYVTTDEARWARDKVHVLAERLRANHPGLTIHPHPTTLGKANVPTRTLAILTPDNLPARRDGQELFTREIVNVAVGGNTEVDIANLQFGRTACVYCFYRDVPEEAYDLIAALTELPVKIVRELYTDNAALEPAHIELMSKAPRFAGVSLKSYVGQPLRSLMQRPDYGAVPVSMEGGPAVAVTTAFVSAFAGTLGLIEAIKASVPALLPHRLSERLRWDLLGTFSSRLVLNAPPAVGCPICENPIRRAFYDERWAE